MTFLKVLPYPNPFLRRMAAPVEIFDKGLKKIIADMEETMAERDGIGLAATQVGLDMRLILLSPVAFDRDKGPEQPNVVVINPEIIWQSEGRNMGEEGCLSFPGVYIMVDRPDAVMIRAQNADGEVFEIEGGELGARAILHEIDHLNGVVMVDLVSHLQRSRALKKHERNQKDLVREHQKKAAR